MVEICERTVREAGVRTEQNACTEHALLLLYGGERAHEVVRVDASRQSVRTSVIASVSLERESFAHAEVNAVCTCGTPMQDEKSSAVVKKKTATKFEFFVHCVHGLLHRNQPCD